MVKVAARASVVMVETTSGDWKWLPAAGGAGHRVAAGGIGGRAESGGGGGVSDGGGGGSDAGGGSGSSSDAVLYRDDLTTPARDQHQ